MCVSVCMCVCVCITSKRRTTNEKKKKKEEEKKRKGGGKKKKKENENRKYSKLTKVMNQIFCTVNTIQRENVILTESFFVSFLQYIRIYVYNR